MLTPTVKPSSKRDIAIEDVKRLTALADKHPLLAPWTGDYGGVPPWDKLDIKGIGPAFEIAIALFLAEVEVIAENPDPPTFENTLIPLDDMGRHQDRVDVLFAILTSNLSNDEVQAVDKEWSPKMAAAYDKITFNDKLFGRIAAIYAKRESSGLHADQKRLVKLRFERFVRAGAKLSVAEKAKVGKINEELAGLFADFGKKVLADENSWIVIDKATDLAGLSDGLKKTYKAAADERKLAGPAGKPIWAVVNTRSSVDPFLTTSSNRAMREKVWKAFKGRGDNSGDNDTNMTIGKIVKLRAERAKLLGYATHAHFRMADTMAKDPDKAKELMLKVWPAAVGRVKEEVADMEKLAKRDGVKMPFEPWDYLYYAEKVRKQRYALDQEAIKPYFELNNMINASFHMAERLYGLTFVEITGKVPHFIPDGRVWEVKDKAGAHVGLFYGDYFARKGKRSGAWAMGYRGHEHFVGKEIRPITSNNNNFVTGAPGEPVLISVDDAETLFHEFGHALHGLLSEVKYPTLSGTPRDFVEYPSQVHEMWVLTRPILDKFALHYKTGKPMPQALLDKIEASSKFNTGYTTVEYLSSAIVDMELHTLADGMVDADAFERDTLTKIGAPKEVAMRHRLPQFNHLFTSDSYSAGYYSYL
ncbi:MAG: M3 family metallopeptidase, partial [Deltaproteobacteria bacterium]|nr:M3 family metallopeptidase [Deltaproteobacteria bacterium]